MRRSSLGWPFSHAASCCAGSRRRALSHLACAGAAAAAACATLSTGLTKATKLASRMICSSPLLAAARRIAASSSAARVAPRLGWRSVRACRTSLGRTSWTKAAPLSFAGRSRRGTLLAHHAVGRSGLHRRGAGGRLGEVDLAGDGPVVLPGRRAVLQELAVDHGEIVTAAVETKGSALQRLGPHLGADQAHRAARHLDRERRRRVELVRAVGGVARQHDDAIERQVELLGGDLADGGDDALPHLDLAGGDAHGAVGLEMDPAIEPRIVDQAGRQRARVHARPPLRRVAAARSTARRMR